MPTINSFMGGAQQIRDVWDVLVNPIRTELGDKFRIAIGNRYVEHTTESAGAVAAQEILGGLKTLIDAAVSDPLMPEWSEVTVKTTLELGSITGLQLIGPADGTPITPVVSSTNGGISIVVTEERQGAVGANAIQRLTLVNGPTGGTFTVTYKGQTTSAQPYNESAANLQADLEALSTIGAGNVSVTKTGNYWEVTFIGALAYTVVPLMTTNGTNLTFGAGVFKVQVTTEQEGSAGKNQKVGFIIPQYGGTFTITINGQTTSAQAYNDTEAAITTDLEALSNIAAGEVVVTSEYAGYDRIITIEFTGTFAGANLANVTVNGASLTNTAGMLYISKITDGANTVPGQFQVLPSYSGGPFTLSFYHPVNGGRMDITKSLNESSGSLSSRLNALASSPGSPFNGASFTVQEFTGNFHIDCEGDLLQYQIGIGSSASPGITRAVCTSGGSLNVFRQQSGSPTKAKWQVGWLGPKYATGNFTLRLTRLTDNTAATTGNIAWVPTAATYKTGLDALTNAGTFTTTDIDTYSTLIESDDAGVPYLLEVASYGTLAGITLGQPFSVQTGVPGTNEIKRVAITGGPVAGTFTLTTGGSTTNAIARLASALTVQTELEAESTVGSGGVSVSGSAGGPWLVEYKGLSPELRWTDLGDDYLTGNGGSLSGGTVDVGMVQNAAKRVDEVQKVAISNALGGTWTLTFGIYTTPALSWNISPEALQTYLEALASIGVGKLLVSGAAGGPYTLMFTGTLGGSDQGMFVADGNNLTGSASQQLSIEHTIVGTGPNYWNNADNWSQGTVPAAGERWVLSGSVPIKFGMSASGLTPELLLIMNNFEGIGLPDWNPLGYPEYRPKNLTLGAAGVLCPTIIGEGAGDGPSIVRLDYLTSRISCRILNSGQPTSTADGPAVRIVGGATHSTSRIEAIAGSIGIAYGEEEVCVVDNLLLSYFSSPEADVAAWIGAGATPGAVKMRGGQIYSNCAAFSLLMEGGKWFQERNGFTVSSLTGEGGGEFIANVAGTISGTAKLMGTALITVMDGVGNLSFAAAPELYGDDADIVDPFKRTIITGQTYMDTVYKDTSRRPNQGRNYTERMFR